MNEYSVFYLFKKYYTWVWSGSLLYSFFTFWNFRLCSNFLPKQIVKSAPLSRSIAFTFGADGIGERLYM